MNGGAGVACKQVLAGGQTLYRPDSSGADYGTALGWTAPGQWYKYKVVVLNAGRCNLSVPAGSDNGANGRSNGEESSALFAKKSQKPHKPSVGSALISTPEKTAS